MKIEPSMNITDIASDYGYENVFDFITNIHNIRGLIDDNECLKNIENNEYYMFDLYRSFISNFHETYKHLFTMFLRQKYSLLIILDTKNNNVHIYKIKDKNIEHKLTINAIKETDVDRFDIIECIENDNTFTIYSTFDFVKCLYHNNKFLGKIQWVTKLYDNVYKIIYSDNTTGIYRLNTELETILEAKNGNELYTFYTNKYSTKTEYFAVMSYNNNTVEVFNITGKTKSIFKTKGVFKNYGKYSSTKTISIQNGNKYTFYDLEDKHLILENSDFIDCNKKRLNAEDYYVFNDRNYKYYICKQDKMQLILDEIDELEILDEIGNIMIITKNEESDLLSNFKSVEIKKTPTLLMHYYNEYM